MFSHAKNIEDGGYYFEQTKFRLSRLIAILLSCSLLVISVVFYIYNFSGWLVYSIGFVISAFSWFWLERFHTYLPVALIFIFGGSALVSYSLLYDRYAIHLIDPFWLVCISLYSFITMGKKWGILLFTYTSAIMAYYLTQNFNENVRLSELTQNRNTVAMAVELFLCLTIIAFFISHFIDSVNYSEKKHHLSNHELQRRNKELVKKENEKTVLLQEIHHRVKNNLQIIVSLLRMQSHEIESDEARENFQQAINRVLSMSLIHQRMYEENNLSDIQVQDYLKVLIRDMLVAHEQSEKVTYTVNGNLSSLGLKSMVPLGLITTELVSNSIKHAFESGGEIKITINQLSEENFSFLYFDSGKWKSPYGNSFGLTLIDTLTDQLDGTYQRKAKEEGTFYEFSLHDIDE